MGIVVGRVPTRGTPTGWGGGFTILIQHLGAIGLFPSGEDSLEYRIVISRRIDR